jgi:hypothetical protein
MKNSYARRNPQNQWVTVRQYFREGNLCPFKIGKVKIASPICTGGCTWFLSLDDNENFVICELPGYIFDAGMIRFKEAAK